MTRFRRPARAWSAALIAAGLTAAAAKPLPAAATATFGGADATYPGTMKIAGKAVTFDLSAVGRAEVYRAVFRPKREVFNGHDRRALEKVTVTSGGKAVPLMAPRFRSFDATGAVRAASKGGQTLTRQV